MAKYTVTRSCGHEETVSLVGPGSNREWRLENVEPNKLCYECYQEDLKRRREEASREAAEAARVNNLPALTGSEKQIAWAKTIRASMLDRLEEIVATKWNGLLKLSDQECRDAIEHIKNTETSAHWWIDRRHDIKSPVQLVALLKDRLAGINSDVSESDTGAMEAAIEATLRPESPVTETVAEIRAKESSFEIVFPEKRDDFRDLVKGRLKMHWSDGKWARGLGILNGTPADRAAEAGHRLLAAGFPVRIFDDKIRQMVVTGAYNPECSRWISRRAKGDYTGWLSVGWGNDDDFYKAARKLPGSRWDKPGVVVPPENYEEVLDFANKYGFQVSPGAQEVIKAAKEIRQRALIPDLDAPQETKPFIASTIPAALDVPDVVEIDDEFKD